eukprot:813870-Alexandrium_andersonii.AAC.1
MQSAPGRPLPSPLRAPPGDASRGVEPGSRRWLPLGPADPLHGRHGYVHQAAGAQHAVACAPRNAWAACSTPHARRALPRPALAPACAQRG